MSNKMGASNFFGVLSGRQQRERLASEGDDETEPCLEGKTNLYNKIILLPPHCYYPST